MRRLIPADPLLPDRARGLVLRLVAVGAGQAVAAVGIALAVNHLFRAAQSGAAPAPLPVAALFAAVLMTAWLRYRERLDGERLGQAVAHSVRTRLVHHMMKLPTRTAPKSAGDLVLRFTGDLNALRNWYAGGLAALVVGVPVLLGGLGGIALVDMRLALALAGVAALGILAQRALTPGLRQAGEEAQRARGRLASDVAEKVTALASIQAFGRSGSEARRIEQRSAALGEAMVARAHWSGLLRAASEWGAAALPLVILLVWMLGGGGDAAAGASTLAIGGLVAPRLRDLGRIGEYRVLAAISRDRISDFMAMAVLDDRGDARKLTRGDGRLILRGLALKGVFRGVSAEAEPGARIALTGANGVGKSRLMGLVAGLEEPTSGTIVLDRQNASGRQLASLRRLVALAGVDSPLLKGTVESNIRYGARLDGAEAAAMRALGGHDALLAELPKGGQTRIGAGGQGLSQGQRRRVALLRALMRGPLVLLLDEIEANLDSAGQETLRNVLKGFPGTILMATHSPDWAAACDAVWTLSPEGLSVQPTQDPGAKRHA